MTGMEVSKTTRLGFGFSRVPGVFGATSSGLLWLDGLQIRRVEGVGIDTVPLLSVPLASGRVLDVAFRLGRNALLEMTPPKN